MVLNAAVQLLREADELKLKLSKFKVGTSMLQERSLWSTQQQLQKIYQQVLVLDLDYALDKKVEQDLWNVGFKQQIDALQAISKDRKNALRSEGQAMLSWVLQAAAGFYLCLLHQICTTFKLDLPFRRRASLLGWVEGWGAGEVGACGGGAGAGSALRLPAPAAARYICQHCLVHLGDLQRYRHQPRSAHSFYRHALVVSVHSGQPYNQLALVAWRRGRRLGALYWHVRALLVRAPFPPALDNLARTLRAAAATSRENTDLPVIPGVTDAPALHPARTAAHTPASTPARLDAHSYVTEFIRAIHLIHTVEELDTASALVESLNSSLSALVAADSFESMTLIKMACVIVWAVHSSTEGLGAQSSALTGSEARAAHLVASLPPAALLALLLPSYTRPHPPPNALPALKVWLQWAVCDRSVVSGGAWATRPQLWPALAHTLNRLTEHTYAVSNWDGDKYDSVPLPEDEELHGFLPLEESFKGLRFANHATWDTYGGRVPDVQETYDPLSVLTTTCFNDEPELELRVRTHRLLRLGKRLADHHTDHLSYTEEDGRVKFSAPSIGGEQLSRALAELALSEDRASVANETGDAFGDSEADTDDENSPPPAPPPIVISEADFREKVREKRVGILKPQGSLERAREERAMATTQDDQQEIESSEENTKGDDKKEARKARVNIAMAAIMRKQEETNKQVKFVTPPPTPDCTTASNESKNQDKPKVIQPKAIKSLANLPIGRKTGGILSLKDKSAGYPHLVNAETDAGKKTDKEDKKEPKLNQSSSQSSQQNYPQKQMQQTSPLNWNANMSPKNFSEQPRMGFQKNYGIQNAGITYNPNNYQAPGVNNQGIRLPVVNPKEIDVRTAALQKQNSRQELFQEGQKFGNHTYQVSGDKKNFLNDLPPRFANQYRYWQNAQDNRFNDSQLREEGPPTNQVFPQQQHSNWLNQPPPVPDQYQQLMPWWKPENPPPNLNPNFSAPSLNLRPNFYPPHLAANMTNPYHNMPSLNQMPNQSIGQNKPDTSHVISPPNYLQSSIGQPQFQTLQNIVGSTNFNSPLNTFNSYTPRPGYETSMYPQFNNNLNYQPPQLKMPDKPPTYLGNKDLLDMGTLSFGSNLMDIRQGNANMKFNNLNEFGAANNMNQINAGEMPAPAQTVGVTSPESGLGNTYSLFSGTDPRAPHPHPQSLWSGPGPSPLERLLEQQKQMKQQPVSPSDSTSTTAPPPPPQ